MTSGSRREPSSSLPTIPQGSEAPGRRTRSRTVADDYYAGVLAFKRWQYAEASSPFVYDWADLSDEERAEWAKIEREEAE
jgi:hypothetical protein